jgi:hypothetical protein
MNYVANCEKYRGKSKFGSQLKLQDIEIYFVNVDGEFIVWKTRILKCKREYIRKSFIENNEDELRFQGNIVEFDKMIEEVVVLKQFLDVSKLPQDLLQQLHQTIVWLNVVSIRNNY